MKIVFTIIGFRNLIEEEVKSGETVKAIIARIAQMLHMADQADMILVYKAVDPFEKDDSAVKKLQKGSISAHNLQLVSRNDTVKIQACAADKVHFALDVPIRDDSIFFRYATERRYLGTYCYCFATAKVSLILT
ncbi:hypothetical protein P3T76_008968 [Phytophthora citrophthora]|uniref:Uncharacterized protein n=1 Tax=Phytophthora citrophthora TaxID=4793 RepID=A0AAD9GI95_9STRA|nr:hypothetical protein P3T76_008968 [Phytophthora citrophthora]